MNIDVITNTFVINTVLGDIILPETIESDITITDNGAYVKYVYALLDESQYKYVSNIINTFKKRLKKIAKKTNNDIINRFYNDLNITIIDYGEITYINMFKTFEEYMKKYEKEYKSMAVKVSDYYLPIKGYDVIYSIENDTITFRNYPYISIGLNRVLKTDEKYDKTYEIEMYRIKELIPRTCSYYPNTINFSKSIVIDEEIFKDVAVFSTTSANKMHLIAIKIYTKTVLSKYMNASQDSNAASLLNVISETIEKLIRIHKFYPIDIIYVDVANMNSFIDAICKNIISLSALLLILYEKVDVIKYVEKINDSIIIRGISETYPSYAISGKIMSYLPRVYYTQILNNANRLFDTIFTKTKKIVDNKENINEVLDDIIDTVSIYIIDLLMTNASRHYGDYIKIIVLINEYYKNYVVVPKIAIKSAEMVSTAYTSNDVYSNMFRLDAYAYFIKEILDKNKVQKCKDTVPFIIAQIARTNCKKADNIYNYLIKKVAADTSRSEYYVKTVVGDINLDKLYKKLKEYNITIIRNISELYEIMYTIMFEIVKAMY